MNRQTASYAVGIGIIVLIIVFVLVFIATRNPANSPSQVTNKTAPKSLQDYANSDAVVTYTTEGQINGNEQHRTIRINVNKNNRTLEIINGYQGQVASSSSFTNNSDAYSSFLAAIDRAGFSKRKPDTQNLSIAGQCPLGIRYIYSAKNIENFPDNLWSTTCSTKSSTFAGNPDTIRRLFQLQIPDYSTLTRDVRLN